MKNVIAIIIVAVGMTAASVALRASHGPVAEPTATVIEAPASFATIEPELDTTLEGPALDEPDSVRTTCVQVDAEDGSCRHFEVQEPLVVVISP